MPDLETVDLPGVEIMAACGPIHGVGSPPEGDTYTSDDLRAMAAAANELAEEGFKPPAKIGHEATAPRVGWLDRIRVSDDGQKLLADIRDVPKKFAALVKAGAYRARSPELYRITSQKTGKRFENVPGGLAWLGAKRPAIHGLGDLDAAVLAMFEGTAEPVRAFEFVNETPPASERLLEAVIDLAGKIAGASDSKSMPELKITEEAKGKLAEKLGVKAEDLTEEKLFEAVEALAKKAEQPDDDKPTGDEKTKAFEERVAKAEKEAADAKADAKRANDELQSQQKRAFVEDVIRQGKEEPGRRAAVETIFDKLGAGEAAKFYEGVKPNETLAREYGSDEDGNDEPTVEQQRALEEELEEVFPGYDRVEVKV